MERVIIKSGRYKKKTFEINENNQKLISKLAKELRVNEKEILEAVLLDKPLENHSNLKKMKELKEELLHLQKEMFSIEGEWSAIRYKSHVIAHEVKNLSVALIGLLNQNRMLRRQLNMEQKYGELKKLAENYLFMKMKS